MNKYLNSSSDKERQYAPLALVIIGAVVSAYDNSGFLVLFLFFLTIVAYTLRDYNCRILLSTGILLLILGFFNTLTGQESQAAKTGDVAFFFLSTGVTGVLLQHLQLKNLFYNNPKSTLEKIKRYIIASYK